MPAPVLIFWNVVTNETQASFVHTCLVPEELGWPLFLKELIPVYHVLGQVLVREGRRCFSRTPVQHRLVLLRELVQKGS